jgi:hypothetical protein
VRLASGAPGPKYWQQRADYSIEARIDEAAHVLHGDETITYKNLSPHTLDYLWVQLDQNAFRKDSVRRTMAQAPRDFEKFQYKALKRLLASETWKGGVTLKAVELKGEKASYTVVKTMMRVDLPTPLRPGQTTTLRIAWSHPIIDAKTLGGRGGYERLDDGQTIYTIAQWFPRMASYNDVDGWQHKQFWGRGEFTLDLGDYEVELTVPSDHVVAATGVLQNPRAVMKPEWRKRMKAAQKSNEPLYIVTPEEAAATTGSKSTATWKFAAENVRDFAFASSRRFAWDAMGVDNASGPEDGPKRVLCMSFYPPQAAPLWKRYSSQAVAHTIEVYGRMTFKYPYPVSISVNGPVGGMEYPMITFNGPRAEKDGTYYARGGKGKSWRRTKIGLISVVIHEVGHNWFPMIINSDERQWTWMDEGLNTFLQYVTEQEWERNYPSWRGRPSAIIPYMKSDRQVPIMSNSESLLQFGNNAYAKPATALNILRETILGREVFDFAFKTYTRRWRFKKPMPADFFRSMEDAAGIDLDWFWRGWFYTTEHVDLGIVRVHEYALDSRNPTIEKPKIKAARERKESPRLTQLRNDAEGKTYRVDRYPALKDFYNRFDKDAVSDADIETYQKLLKSLNDEEKALLETKRHFYVVEFENKGGLVMPLLLHMTYADGSTEDRRLPVAVWRHDAKHIKRFFVTKQPIVRIEIDRQLETADADRRNNVWPPEPVKSRFKLFKQKRKKNEMQKSRDRKARRDKGKAGTGAKGPNASKPAKPGALDQ